MLTSLFKSKEAPKNLPIVDPYKQGREDFKREVLAVLRTSGTLVRSRQVSDKISRL